MPQPTPALHELHDGHYHLRLAASGGGASLWDWIALNRWAGDPVEDAHGFFVYLRDLDGGALWSAGRQPTGVPAGDYAFEARADMLAIARRDHGIATRMEVSLIPGADIERRRVRVHNGSNRPRRIELTSYLEVALAHPQGDLGHPAFSKLFVQTEWRPELGALVARRRPRAQGDAWPALFHALRGAPVLQWETDRARFVGRGRSAARPALRMAGTVGNVLDPAFALRTVLELAPGEARELDFLLGATPDHDAVAALLARHAPADLPAAASAFASPPASSIAPPLAPTPASDAASTVAPEPPAPCPIRAGFNDDRSEYAIALPWNGDGLQLPPMPWINVIANERLGFLVSETGAGGTWGPNSQAHRITPWSNDPVSDPHDEALLLRDDDSRAVWSPLPGPAPAPVTYEARHGFGYTRFASRFDGLAQTVTVFAAAADPLKIVRVQLRNEGPRARRLSLYAYQRLVLGSLPAPGLRVWRAGEVLCATRPGEPGIAFAFALANLPCAHAMSGDRARFLGAGGSPRAPQALRDETLEEHFGDDLDACFARQLRFTLDPGAGFDGGFALGHAADENEVHALVARYRETAGDTAGDAAPGTPGNAAGHAAGTAAGHTAALAAAFDAAALAWRERLAGLRVHTPAPEIDAMVNGWLPYQALACRIRGRTAFYQSSGAYGFRDQLQDAGNLALLWPALTRDQIVLHAQRQFAEGDVLHWWHDDAPLRGVRTRFADDLLWLPYVALHYVAETGDDALFDEALAFVQAPPLAPGEDERYAPVAASDRRASLYDHCCRALDRSLARGAHGLPLMGTGDWNDGMNRVGREGRGESVWLGFFLCEILARFVPLARARGDAARAERYAAHRAELVRALDDTGWDGAWYRRAYYDDGTPLGTQGARECRIDALVQAWAVLAGATDPARARQAMDAAEAQLVDESAGLIRLLTPPFVNTPEDPGYIKGYVAGVRENGGQYTHAACWVVAALARLGRRDRAARLLTMLSPQWHARSAGEIARYRVEPYVIAADVYGAPPHVGRGGWTWYTGAAGWAWRVAVESVLGLRVERGATLVVAPCVPDDWPGYRIEYRRPGARTRYAIEVVNPQGCSAAVVEAALDGRPLTPAADGARIALADDGTDHEVLLVLGPRA